MLPKPETYSRRYYEECWSTGGVYAQATPVPLDPAIHRFLETYLSPDARCLDVGCGDGKTAGSWLTNRTSHYVGVDISQNAVRRARELGLNAKMIEDASNLPFPSSTFDLVLCNEVLEHLFQPQLAAVEILRVLQPGAMMIATVPNVTHWRHRLSFCFAGRWDPYGDSFSVERPWRDPHIRFFTSKTLQRMLTLAGFDHVQISGGVPERLRRAPWARRSFDRIAGLPWVPTWVSRRLVAIARKPPHGGG